MLIECSGDRVQKVLHQVNLKGISSLMLSVSTATTAYLMTCVLHTVQLRQGLLAISLSIKTVGANCYHQAA